MYLACPKRITYRYEIYDMYLIYSTCMKCINKHICISIVYNMPVTYSVCLYINCKFEVIK